MHIRKDPPRIKDAKPAKGSSRDKPFTQSEIEGIISKQHTSRGDTGPNRSNVVLREVKRRTPEPGEDTRGYCREFETVEVPRHIAGVSDSNSSGLQPWERPPVWDDKTHYGISEKLVAADPDIPIQLEQTQGGRLIPTQDGVRVKLPIDDGVTIRLHGGAGLTSQKKEKFFGRSWNIGVLGAVAALAIVAVIRIITGDDTNPAPPKEEKIERKIAEGELEKDVGIYSPQTMPRYIFPPKTFEDHYRDAVADPDQEIYMLAAKILKNNDNLGPLHLTQILDLFDYMKNNIRYLSVIEDSEPKPAMVTIWAKAGDCKNLATTMAALGSVIGGRMAVFVVDYEANEFGYRIGHAYAGFRVYTPTLEELANSESRSKKYEAIREQVSKLIKQRYPELTDLINGNTITFLENLDGKEGIWLVLDPTYEKEGYPGRLSGKNISYDFAFTFGKESAVPDMR